MVFLEDIFLGICLIASMSPLSCWATDHYQSQLLKEVKGHGSWECPTYIILATSAVLLNSLQQLLKNETLRSPLLNQACYLLKTMFYKKWYKNKISDKKEWNLLNYIKFSRVVSHYFALHFVFTFITPSIKASFSQVTILHFLDLILKERRGPLVYYGWVIIILKV